MKLVYFVILSLFCFMCEGQNWFPLKASWHYSAIKYDTASGEFYNSYYLMEIDRDTVFQGKLCKVLKRNQMSCDLLANEVILQEDSGAVVYWNVNNNRFDTLINMNAVVGGSWVINPNSTLSSDSIVITVIDKSLRIINDDTLQLLVVDIQSNDWTWNGSDSIIERVGYFPGFFFFQLEVCDFQIGKLRCYEDDSIGLFETNEAAFCEEETGLAINTIEIPTSVFPNPSNSTISFFLPAPAEYRIIVFNTSGEQVIESAYSGSGLCELSINNLPSGLYYIWIIGDDLYSSRFIKVQ